MATDSTASVPADYGFAVAPSPEEMAAYQLNDLGNAMRLMRLAGAQLNPDGTCDTRNSTLLFQVGIGWVASNEKYWDHDYGEELARLKAHAVAIKMAALYTQISEAWPLEKPADIVKYLKGLGSSGSTSGMLRQAQSYLTVKITEFDSDPLALNCRNGTLKLRRIAGDVLERRLDPHDPADRITRMAAVDYVPDADCPEFKRVVRESFQRSAAEREYFHRCCGYAVTGLRTEQAFFVCQGKGRDGKSTILDASRQALGSYASAADVTTFLDAGTVSSAGATPDLARLSGDVRLVVLSEPKKGAVWNESRLKGWTSGAPIVARHLNQRSVEFAPVGKLFVECNVFPRPRSDDDGFWRRIRVVLFRHQVPLDKVDIDLPARIAKGELPGVLNWLLDGLEQYLAAGLGMPETLAGFAGAYRTGGSPLLDWFQECVAWGDDAGTTWSTAKDIRASLNDWWDEQGHDPNKRVSMRTLGDFLTDRQIGTRRTRTGNVERGPMRLKTPFERAAAHDAAAGRRPAAAGGLSERDRSRGDEGSDE